MTDAPMTPRELAKVAKQFILLNGSAYAGFKDELYAQLITDRDAAIRREAQAEALEQAIDACKNEKRCYADSHRVHDKFCHDQDISAIRALSPIPNYRERIVALAKLEQTRFIRYNRLDLDVLICDLRADLARLAADAEGKS